MCLGWGGDAGGARGEEEKPRPHALRPACNADLLLLLLLLLLPLCRNDGQMEEAAKNARDRPGEQTEQVGFARW